MRIPFTTATLRRSLPHLPVIIALAGVLVGGLWLLLRSDTQARDTIRKHHLQDIEDALYLAYSEHGTYPPYAESTWCGSLQNPANAAVRAQVETALRQQNAKYANPAKPFPADPLLEQPEGLAPRFRQPVESAGYFYWKRSPAVFELYSHLETHPTGDRSSFGCPGATLETFDYGINSRLRVSQVPL